MVSAFSLLFLNLERYLSIIFPIFHHTKISRSRVVRLLPIVWVLGIAEESLLTSAFTSTNGLCSVGTSKYHSIMFWLSLVGYIILQYFVPIFLFLFIYGHMILRLKKPKPFGPTNRGGNTVMEKARNNVFKTMFILTLCYTICYTFNCVYLVLFLRGNIKTLSGEYLLLNIYLFHSVLFLKHKEKLVCTIEVRSPFLNKMN